MTLRRGRMRLIGALACSLALGGPVGAAEIACRFYKSPSRLPGQTVRFGAGTQADALPARTPISIDGRINEWGRKQKIGVAIWRAGGGKTKVPATVYAAYDRSALFLAAVCPDTGANLKAADVARRKPVRDSGAVASGDCIKFHLDNDADPTQFFTIAANALGDWDDARVTDAGARRWLPPIWTDMPGRNPVGDFFGPQGYGRAPRTRDLKWNPDVRVAAGRRPGAWTVEMRVPWESLGVRDPDRLVRLRFNAVRFKRTAPSHTASWAMCGGRYFVPSKAEIHYASKYGCLRLRPAPFALETASAPRPLYGRNTLDVKLRGAPTRSEWPLRVTIRRSSKGREEVSLAAVDAKWPAGKRVTSLCVPFDLAYRPKEEKFRLRLRIETSPPDAERETAGIPIENLTKDFRITPDPLHFFVLKGRYYDGERAAHGIAKVDAADKGEVVSRQILRLRFYAKRAEIPVEHTWIFTADSDKVRLRDLAVGLNVRTDGAARATFNTAPDWRQTVSRDVEPGVALAMRQDWYPHFGDPRSVFGLYEREGAAERPLARGEAGGNWARVSSAAGVVAVVVKDFPYLFPKELEARRDGIVARLWTDRGGLLMDMSAQGMMKYWGDNFTSRYRKKLARLPSQAFGVARTHEIVLRFGPPDAPMSADAALASRTQRPPYVMPEPAWTCASGVFGHLHPVDDQRFPRAEHFLRDRMDRINEIVGLWDFGFFDHGAGPHNGYRFDENGRFQVLDYRYTDHEYGTDKYLWLHLWRSGERRYYEHAERHSRYLMDVPACHATNESLGRYSGMYSVNSPIAWGGRHDPSAPTHFAHRIETALFHYFFTGRRRALDVVSEYAEAKKRAYGYARSAPFENDFHGMERSGFANLREFRALYEFTGDPQILEMCHDLARRLVLPDTEAGIDLDKRGHPPRVAHEKYKIVPLTKYYKLTRRDEVRASAIKLADWTYRTYNRGGVYGVTYSRGAWGYMFANAYRFTGQPRYASFLRAGLDAMSRNVGHFATDRLPERNWKRAGYMLSAPYAMDVLASLDAPPPPIPFAIVEEGLPNVVCVMKADAAVTLDIFCSTMDGLELLGPDGRDRSGLLGAAPRRQYVAFRLGKDATPGVYRLRHRNRGRFLIVDTDADKVVVEAPQGMMMDALEGCPAHFFLVPKGTSRFAVRTSLPEFLRVRDEDGRDVKPARSRRGALTFAPPPADADRMWSVDASRFSTTRDYGKAVFVALEGAPAALAPRSPKRFFLPPNIPMAAYDGRERTEDPGRRFAKGRSARKGDRSLRLADGSTFTIPLGKELVPLTFERFDARRGTIEMFVRFLKTPAEFDEFWAMNVFHEAAGMDNFALHYGFPKRTFWIEFQDRKGARGRWHHSALPSVFLLDGRWHHLALTWRGGGPRLAAELYVDGMRVTRPGGQRISQPRAPAGGLTIGGGQGNWTPFCGDVDDVRVSNTVRYAPPASAGPALPLQACFTPPSATRAAAPPSSSKASSRVPDQAAMS